MAGEIISDSSSVNFCGPIKAPWGAAATKDEKERRRQRRRHVADMLLLRSVVVKLQVRQVLSRKCASWQATSVICPKTQCTSNCYVMASLRHIFEEPKILNLDQIVWKKEKCRWKETLQPLVWPQYFRRKPKAQGGRQVPGCILVARLEVAAGFAHLPLKRDFTNWLEIPEPVQISLF